MCNAKKNDKNTQVLWTQVMEDNDDSKLRENSAMDGPSTLCDICDWDYPENVAIEYHDLEKRIFINYGELRMAREAISDCLAHLKSFEFIGINFDVLDYFVPTLMLGIINSGHGFVNLSAEPTVRNILFDSLPIKYFFARNIIEAGVITRRLKIYDDSIYLIRIKDDQKKNVVDTEKFCYAYAITTSGTTGLSKIVRVPYSCILPNIFDLKRILGLSKSDKIAQLTNFTFDPSIVEIFLALSTSATLFMASKSLKNDANRLLQEIYINRISVLQMTPSVFLYSWSMDRLKATVLSEDSFLRVLILGGEPFPKLELFHRITHPENHTRIFNIYGITEVSCWASINEITRRSTVKDTRNLGTPLSHTVFEIRNEEDEIITKGTGLLYIGSNTRICNIDNELVEATVKPVFRCTGDLVNIDEEGNAFYLGRKNNVIKRFGNKVNLQALEETVLELNFVKNCHVLWDEDKHKLHLCLAVEKNVSEYSDMKSGILNHLKKLETVYKPDKIHFLESFKFTSSGKMCVHFLREQCIEETVTDENVVDIVDYKCEAVFESICKDHLNFGTDGFIKSGGTSIVALQISSALSEALDMEFPELIGMLLRNATFDECLVHIKSNYYNRQEKSSVPSKRTYPIEEQIMLSGSVNTEKQMSSTDPLTLEHRENSYQWQKCRGQTHGSVPGVNKNYSLGSKIITTVEVLNFHNLHKCIDASPTVYKYLDGATYATVGSHSGIICTVQLKEKTYVASYEIKLPDRIEASVLVLDDFRGIVGCYDGNVYCLHLKTGEVFWKFQTADMVKCTAVCCERRKKIFLGSYDYHAYCLSIKDGSQIWKTKGSDGSISASGCLHLQTNTILFGTLDGTCLALEQSSGKMIWRHKLRDPIFVAPLTLSNGLVLFCSVAGILYCFDIEINVEMWKYNVNGNVFSYIVKQDDPVKNSENIILSSQNKNVYCLESKDSNFKTEPTLKYALNFDSPIFATPWCEDNFLFIACTNGTLNVHNIEKRETIKMTKLPGDVFSSPVVHDDLLIVGCRDNNMYILKLT